jgi:glycosyltransferase involved in cell wall biosynthesis
VPLLLPARFIVTIHDLILLNYPTERATTLGPILYKIKNFAYHLIIRSAVKKSQKIIAVSDFTKKDIVRHFKIDAGKVLVTYEGVAGLNQNLGGISDDDAVLAEYHIAKPYLLYVGNAYPHKNLEGLLRVFAQLLKAKPELKLVLVGKEDYFYARLKRYAAGQGLSGGADPAVIFAGYVPDGKLTVLYRHGLAYIFPSFYEGFGLPPLEAMASGLPVVSSDRTSLPEVLGPAALYFNPADEAAMLAQIKNIIEDERLRRDLIKASREQIKKYDWQTCANKTLAIYLSCLKPNS